MIAALIHATVFIIYATLSIAVGYGAWAWEDYSVGVSACLGGLVLNTSALVHFILTPRKARLAKKDVMRIDNEFQMLKDAQAATKDELIEVRDALTAEAQQREENLTKELRDIALLISQFAARTDKKLAAAAANPAPSVRVAPRRSDQSLLNAVKAAIEDNRVEMHIQPIVSLPQRRVTYYEGFTRLRDVTGGLILPGEFMRVAEPSGLMNEIDNLLLLRCVQIARRMIKQDRRMGLFCNISPSSLGDESFFPQFISFLRENRDLAGSIIFEIGREHFDRLPMAAERNMGRLFDLGFRFSIDRCDSIDLDLRKLERMGVRYVKIAGDTLVKQMTGAGAMPVTGLAREFEASDVASLFARYGVDLIADRVENERTVVEILELEVSFAQGNLFGAPRSSQAVMDADEDMRRVA